MPLIKNKKGQLQLPKTKEVFFQEVARQTIAFCKKYLTDEYAALTKKLTYTLCCYRPFPMKVGRRGSWIGAIVYTVGWLNFLFDKKSVPHMSEGELCEKLGVSVGNVEEKSAYIRKILKLLAFDPEWTLPSKMDENPLSWLVRVEGFLTKALELPPPKDRKKKRLAHYTPFRNKDL